MLCRVLNDRLRTTPEKEENASERQAKFRPNPSGVDHVNTLGMIIQVRKEAGLPAYCFFLDVQKAYEAVWTYGRKQ